MKSFKLDEVWILQVNLAPDMPFTGGWTQMGIFRSYQGAKAKLEDLVANGERMIDDNNQGKSWNIQRKDVED